MRARTCDGCRAQTARGTIWDPGCQLGYPLSAGMETNKHVTTVFKVRPLGECPKPTTWKEFFRLRGPVGTPSQSLDTEISRKEQANGQAV